MKGTKTYQDGFVAVFTEQEAFLECIRDRLSNSFWDRGKTRNLRFAELTEDGPIAERIREKCSREGTDEGIIADTISNTGLVLRVRNEYYPVRNCAIRSILDRAGISGCGLRRVSRNVYARILNDCLKVAKGDALLRISEGKVSAVLGGDAGDYSVIDAEKLYMHTIDYLNNNFKGVSYLGGFYEHDKVSAIWELSGEKKLLEAYKKELDMLGVLGMRPEDMTPVVRITTSDTGAGGANIYPMLLCGRGTRTVMLGDALRVEHKNGADIADYDKQLRMLYGKYQLALGNLSKLLSVEIANPINCMKGVMDKLRVARRYAAEAVELFEAQNGANPCTAHDIYYGISEVLYLMACSGEGGGLVTAMEEKVARALSLKWEEYDIPGKYRW